jgi:hypothetical protein
MSPARRTRRLRLSPAIAISALALAVSLSGTAVATVAALPRNSVGTVQLRSSAVVSAKVRNGSLARADVRGGQVSAGPTGPQGPAGPVGPSGPAGSQGPKGDRGDASIVATFVAGCAPVPTYFGGHTGSYLTGSCAIACPAGSHAISVGASWDAQPDDQETWLSSIRPVVDPSGAVTRFDVRGGNDSGSGRTLRAHVLCFVP